MTTPTQKLASSSITGAGREAIQEQAQPTPGPVDYLLRIEQLEQRRDELLAALRKILKCCSAYGADVEHDDSISTDWVAAQFAPPSRAQKGGRNEHQDH